VDLVDKQDVAVAKLREDGGQVTLLLEDRPAGGMERHPHLVGQDGGERRLAEAGRPCQQHVIKRFAALLGRLQKDAQLFAQRRLAHECAQ
jgi:hypothetical protein